MTLNSRVAGNKDLSVFFVHLTSGNEREKTDKNKTCVYDLYY